MTETSDYHQREDEPDMSNPAVAQDMYNTQAAQLATVLEDTGAFVTDASQKLGDIHTYAEQNNMPDLAAHALAIYENVTKLHHSIQHQDAARRGAEAVIKAVTDQRDEVVKELGELVAAINHGDEQHPKLAGYAEEIRQDEAEYQQEWAGEYAMESAFESVHDELTTNVQNALMGIGIRQWLALHYAHCIIEVFNLEQKLNDVQAEMIRQFCTTLPPIDGWLKNMDTADQNPPIFDDAEFIDDDDHDGEELDVDD